jgi:hypothetical protein
MADLPFESTIRDFIWKINDELERVRVEIDKTGIRTIDSTGERYSPAYVWESTLKRLHSICTSAISSNIEYRKHTKKN